MKKLVSLRRLLEDAQDRGLDPDMILTNPDQVHVLADVEDGDTDTDESLDED